MATKANRWPIEGGYVEMSYDENRNTLIRTSINGVKEDFNFHNSFEGGFTYFDDVERLTWAFEKNGVVHKYSVVIL